MSNLADAERLIATLSRAEKEKVLQLIARDLGDEFPGVESTPGVCGGDPCIVRTRIPIWVLESNRRVGVSEADLLRCYPTLRADDLATAWAFVRAHPAEIERQLKEHREA